MTAKLNLVFAALSDPNRRSILTMLLQGDLTVTEIARPFEISVAAVSKHLQSLSKAGLVVQVRQGRQVHCKLEPGALHDAFIWMEGFGQFVADDYERIEEFLASGLGQDPEQLSDQDSETAIKYSRPVSEE